MKNLFIVATACLLLVSCSRKFEPVNYGKDACAHCRMTIMDERYGAEMVDAKGKVYKFDDITCLRQFISTLEPSPNDLLFVEDYHNKTDGMLDAKTAKFLKHDFFRSPMNGNYAAFSSEEDGAPIADSLGISFTSWENIQ